MSQKACYCISNILKIMSQKTDYYNEKQTTMTKDTTVAVNYEPHERVYNKNQN